MGGVGCREHQRHSQCRRRQGSRWSSTLACGGGGGATRAWRPRVRARPGPGRAARGTARARRRGPGWRRGARVALTGPRAAARVGRAAGARAASKRAGQKWKKEQRMLFGRPPKLGGGRRRARIRRCRPRRAGDLARRVVEMDGARCGRCAARIQAGLARAHQRTSAVAQQVGHRPRRRHRCDADGLTWQVMVATDEVGRRR